jgi:hypothetical protein
MSNFNFPKGSEWRKWDLQIHVPGSKHADQYSTKKGNDVWEKFIEYIKNSDISVFGITDYYSVAGYETFRDKIKNIEELKNKQFFPCVELRLDINVNDETVRENYENNLTRIKGLTKLIPTNVADLYQIKQEIKEVEENIKKFGEENGIKTYIVQLKKEAEDIKSKSGLSNQEITDYEALLEKEKETTTSITVLSDDKKSLVSFKQNLMQQLESLEKLYNEQSSYLGNDEIKKEFTKEFAKIRQLKTDLLTATDVVIKFVNSSIVAYQKELEKIKNDLIPFMAKVKLQDELKKKNKAISDEQNKLNKIDLEKKKLESKADAEQVIVANQEGQEKGRDNKKFKFEYISGALENSFELPEAKQKAILFRKGIRQHVCEVLEGGQIAFEKREKKYGFRIS